MESAHAGHTRAHEGHSHHCVTSDDGCSCSVNDDPNTVGDDRPGYMACGDNTCATNDECCWDGSGNIKTCLEKGATCEGVWGQCDGPEDCAPDEVCWQARWALCSPVDQTDPRGARRCHTSSQCDLSQDCSSGFCTQK
jgi:hypothetical protein